MVHSRMQKLSEGLGLPGLHHKSYNTHVDDIFEKSSEVMEVILALSREKVLEFYRQNHTEAFQDNGTLDLAVSFDGCWPKRGHISKLGFGAVIDVHTGLDVDFHASVKNEKEDATAYEVWLNEHKASGKCMANFKGSSGAMEVEAALMLWKRSMQHQMRYTVLVGDGDTKTFLALSNANICGDGCPIEKEECVNHVSKRLNTGLRNLKSSLTEKSIRNGAKDKPPTILLHESCQRQQ
ncbi:hypothetical protein PoB_005484100 [Plakobranchus ocellatus]|uniref:Mutator-like transposase domain-containing protein n=1 Tax=Plakobranchus ocellatus TaxID=259542 RepID=A0AAV4CAH7_9GAST|nr:hypothetical protein PoB_005484100 [Plakobranchus ocellatus]